MDAETKARVTARWAEYGLGDLARTGRSDAWSGQGPVRLARLLAEPPASPDDVAPRTERARDAER